MLLVLINKTSLEVAIKEEEEKKLVLRTEQLKADLLAIKVRKRGLGTA